MRAENKRDAKHLQVRDTRAAQWGNHDMYVLCVDMCPTFYYW